MKKPKTLYASLAAAAVLATGLTISPTVSTAAPVDAPAAGPSTAPIQTGSSDSHLVWASTNAKVYSEQDTSSDVLGTLNKGDHVGTRDAGSGQPGGDSGWVPVSYHGEKGFVLGKDVSTTPSHLVWASTTAKVYSEQETSSDVLGTLNKGDHVGTRDAGSGQPGGDSGWVPVTYHGQNGFVLGQDVANSGQTSAS